MPCEKMKIPGGTMIVCSRGQKQRRCSAGGCGEKASRLCDFALNNGKTCDRALCSTHAMRLNDLDLDYCRPHADIIRNLATVA